jgi:hypothetical protein
MPLGTRHPPLDDIERLFVPLWLDHLLDWMLHRILAGAEAEDFTRIRGSEGLPISDLG